MAWLDTKIGDLMAHDVISIHFEASIAELQKLLTSEKISGVPVLAEDDELVGIVSQTDITRLAGEDSGADWKQEQVWQIMTPNVTSTQVDESVTNVAKTMAKAGIHRVLVYEGTKLVGIATSLDFVKLVANGC